MVFNPEGTPLKEIKLPALYPTCPTWGGSNQNILYITTAKDRTVNPDSNDQGGHIYMLQSAGNQGHGKYEFDG